MSESRQGGHEVGARPRGARPHPREQGLGPWWLSDAHLLLYEVFQ